MSDAPIGVFDSGVGGLSVLAEIRQQLPNELLMYVADSGYAPYGQRSCDYIQQRCDAIVQFFLQQGAKAIVVACNTATSVAVDTLRQWCPVPIIAMEPAIKPASLQTQTGVVGVLATQQTLCSDNVSRLIAEHGQSIRVLLQPCTGFVDAVEAGKADSDESLVLVEHYVQPLVAQGADVLVLGCTHYPFLRQHIQQVAGQKVRIIDPAAAIARQLSRRLTDAGMLTQRQQPMDVQFYTTGALTKVQPVLTKLWKEKADVVELITV